MNIVGVHYLIIYETQIGQIRKNLPQIVPTQCASRDTIPRCFARFDINQVFPGQYLKSKKYSLFGWKVFMN